MSFTPNPKPPTTWRLLLIIPGGLALLGGLNGAMMLLDLPVPVNEVRLRDGHGIILVMGFVGTLIALLVTGRLTWSRGHLRAVVAPPQRPHRVGPTLGRSLAGRVSNFMAP